MLVDTHAHVNFVAFKKDADEVLRRALSKEVLVVNVGSQYSTSKRAVEYAEKYEKDVYAAVGLHPIHLQKRDVSNLDPNELEAEFEIKANGEDFDIEKYRELAKNEKVVAIGEAGLDYHHFEPNDDIEKLKKKQKKIFLETIKLANEVEKPIIIHCWDAYQDLIEILEKNEVKKGGVIHSFVGNHKVAKRLRELGYKLGFNGVITYSESYNKVISETPLADMVLETDCPYLTPVPHKGERNEPVHTELIAKKIAEIKNIPFEEVAEVTTKNAKEVFGI